jgi:ribonucleoside-triphosphate reductase
MRTIEEINKDLLEAREELAAVQGGPAEVYSRIVGYYRSVRNWNKGKKEEYGERKLFEVSESQTAPATAEAAASVEAEAEDRESAPACAGACAPAGEEPAAAEVHANTHEVAQPKNPAASSAGASAGASARNSRLLLFVRPACPACPSAKAAAGKLGIPVDMVNADTEDGLAEASRRKVFSTPTAILLSKDGKEITRALDSVGIAALEDLIAG